MSRSKRVYPVPGLYLSGTPHVEHECEDDFCTESGAFTTQPPKADPQPEGPADAGPSESDKE